MPRTREEDIAAIEDRLRGVQRERGLTDSVMASRLRVTRGAWTHVRVGRRRMGLGMVYWAAREFPEALPTMLIFLLGVGHTSPQSEDTRASQSMQADTKGAA